MTATGQPWSTPSRVIHRFVALLRKLGKDRLWVLMRDGLLAIAALTKIDEVALTNAAKRKSAGSASSGQTSTAGQVWIDGPRWPIPRKATSESDHP